jgi:hypothetical protein
VLWRVVLAVLVIFGGIGALIYLIAWLLLLADGDTASPIEALAAAASPVPRRFVPSSAR